LKPIAFWTQIKVLCPTRQANSVDMVHIGANFFFGASLALVQLGLG
jgi:hypothetical protein